MHCTAGKLRHSLGRLAKTLPTILVIEDEAFVRTVTCEILCAAGYRVVQADCATAARNLFSQGGRKIHLLLCDAVLPDASGVSLAQALGQGSPELKTILMSGYPRTGLPQPLGKEHTAEFLAKPFGAASLIAKVQTTLQGAQEDLTSGDDNGSLAGYTAEPATAEPRDRGRHARRRNAAFHRRLR